MISKKLSIVHCQLSIILAFLPLSVAYAQQDSTLNRTVVVENEYNPNIMDASKINVLPRVEEPAVMKKGIEYATALRPVSAWTYESMSPITREWAMNRAKRGYVRAGYGNYGNVDFKAGYLWDITGKDRLKVGVSLDGMNGKLKHWNAEDWKSRFYSTEFRLDYSHDFSKVTLNLGGGLQSQVFNYMPDSEMHTASARATDKQHHTLGDFHIGVSSRDESLPLQFTLQTGLKYFGIKYPLDYSGNASTGKEKIVHTEGDVWGKLDHFMGWLATQYVTALNAIHYMHDKYSYEAALMALHDRDVRRTMACGIAGLSVAADSLSAIKYAKVKPIRDEDGVAIDFEIEGDYPKFGNNDSRVDDIACELVERFMNKIRSLKTYRNAVPTQSILTITSNVVYGKKTGNTPDGRRAGAPFAPGANPMHGRDEKGAVASLTSVGKLPFAHAKDGISYTFSIVPNALGKDENSQRANLAGLMDGYFHHEAGIEGGQHLNVNVLNRDTLLDAVKHPEKYPQLTIRVSGYAVRFNSLTAEQQQDVIARTFTESL